MPDSLNPVGTPDNRPPIILGQCHLEVSSDSYDPPKVNFWIDRERTTNPELNSGLRCERKTESKMEKGKLIVDTTIICDKSPEAHARDVRRWKFFK